jgi:hypothetical protein
MTEQELAELLTAVERVKKEVKYAYEFCPGSFTYGAYVASLNAHRLVEAAVFRMEEAEAA